MMSHNRPIAILNIANTASSTLIFRVFVGINIATAHRIPIVKFTIALILPMKMGECHHNLFYTLDSMGH